MNQELKISVASPSTRRGLPVAALAFVALLGSSQLVQAASFRCPHNASASERLVCDDPTLSALDDKLAALYRTALDATPNTEALEADRVSQWQWRQHNCKDKACVTDWYNRRIAELEGDLKHGKEASIQRVKENVVSQHLVPPAQEAVLRMKGIGVSPDAQPAGETKDGKDTGANAAPAPATTSSPLHLHKMPSGVAADARQKRLAAEAQVRAHGSEAPAASAAAPSAQSKAATAATAAEGGAQKPLDKTAQPGQSAAATVNPSVAAGTTEADAARTVDALNQPAAATVK